MLDRPDPLVVLHMPAECTQDESFHDLGLKLGLLYELGSLQDWTCTLAEGGRIGAAALEKVLCCLHVPKIPLTDTVLTP